MPKLIIDNNNIEGLLGSALSTFDRVDAFDYSILMAIETFLRSNGNFSNSERDEFEVDVQVGNEMQRLTLRSLIYYKYGDLYQSHDFSRSEENYDRFAEARFYYKKAFYVGREEGFFDKANPIEGALNKKECLERLQVQISLDDGGGGIGHFCLLLGFESVYLALGDAYRDAGEYNQAAQAYNEAITFAEKSTGGIDGKPWMRIGDMVLEGQIKVCGAAPLPGEARKWYEKAGDKDEACSKIMALYQGEGCLPSDGTIYSNITLLSTVSTVDDLMPLISGLADKNVSEVKIDAACKMFLLNDKSQFLARELSKGANSDCTLVSNACSEEIDVVNKFIECVNNLLQEDAPAYDDLFPSSNMGAAHVAGGSKRHGFRGATYEC